MVNGSDIFSEPWAITDTQLPFHPLKHLLQLGIVTDGFADLLGEVAGEVALSGGRGGEAEVDGERNRQGSARSRPQRR